MTRRGSRRWRWIGRLLAAAGSAVAFFLVLRRVDPAALKVTFASLKPGWYAAALVTFGLGVLGSALRWHLMLRLNREAVVHGAASVRMVYISHFFNTFLGGPGAGDIPKTALYSRWFGVQASDVIAASVLDRLVASVGGLLFAGTALALGASAGAFDFFRRWQWNWKPPGPWIWVAGTVGILVLIGVVAWSRRRPGSFLGRSLESLRGSARRLVASPRRSAHALMAGFATALLFNLTQVLCLQAVFPGDVPWLKLFWMYHAVTIVAALPVTVAGAGLREGTAMLLLGQYQIDASTAVAGAFLTLSVHLVWAAIGGALLARELRLRKALPADPGPPTRRISVVVPVLNEIRSLGSTLAALRAVPEISEIVIADGGSSDGTTDLARSQGCLVVDAPRGRGQQLRAGCAAASGDILWLVHADTWVPRDAGGALLRCLRDPLVVGGGFWKRFDRPPWIMRGSRLRCWLRLWWGGRILGDQAFFVRRTALDAAGGVPAQSLMEDVELSRRIRQVGRLALAGAPVTTSARRFVERGVLRTYLTMWRVFRAYRRGVPPDELRRMYDGTSPKPRTAHPP